MRFTASTRSLTCLTPLPAMLSMNCPRTRCTARFLRSPDFTPRSAVQPNGSPRRHRSTSAMASKAMEYAPVANSDEQLASVLASLEECRAALRACGKDDTAQLVAVAILDLRMKLGRVADSELKALCDEIMLAADERAREARTRGQ